MTRHLNRGNLVQTKEAWIIPWSLHVPVDLAQSLSRADPQRRKDY
jgi:hypothetical protein